MGQTSFIATNNRDTPVIRVAGERLGVIGAHQLAQTACFGTKNVSSKRISERGKPPAKGISSSPSVSTELNADMN